MFLFVTAFPFIAVVVSFVVVIVSVVAVVVAEVVVDASIKEAIVADEDDYAAGVSPVVAHDAVHAYTVALAAALMSNEPIDRAALASLRVAAEQAAVAEPVHSAVAHDAVVVPLAVALIVRVRALMHAVHVCVYACMRMCDCVCTAAGTVWSHAVAAHSVRVAARKAAQHTAVGSSVSVCTAVLGVAMLRTVTTLAVVGTMLYRFARLAVQVVVAVAMVVVILFFYPAYAMLRAYKAT